MEEKCEEVGLQMNSLPVDHLAVMLSEAEYQEILERGSEEKLPAKGWKGNQEMQQNRQECQPMLSQIKVEDLVMDNKKKMGLPQSRNVLGEEV